MTIEQGKIVWLKSGGPSMTVKYMNTTGYGRCTWFDSKGDIQETEFHKEQLTEVNPNPNKDSPLPIFGG